MEEPKPPRDADVPATAGAPAIPATAPAAAIPETGPPPMPPPIAAIPATAPPELATIAGAPAIPVTAGPPPIPPTPYLLGTIQMHTGEATPSSAAPALPSLGPPPMPGGGAEAASGAGATAAASDAMHPSMPTIAATGGQAALAAAAGPPPALPPARYQLGPEIARGGMGRVMEATDTVLGRVVALKEVLSLDADVLARFARETQITARLEHPSIVPVHDAGTRGGGAPFYVMRKISGRPLEQLVARADTLPQRLVLIPHLVAAAQAVAHAHERGIVHRDIKPSNILVGELGETIVIDWGLAKVIGEAEDPVRVDLSSSLTAAPPLETDTIKTRAGIVYGTPGFMAPEQLRGKPVTERCDVYALGATLYHMLSRKPPHYAKTADEMMRAAVREPPTPVGELVPGVPAELSTIIDKALAHDPGARYQDARALAEDLQRFLSGQLVASHRYSTREKLVRFVKKHRVSVSIALAATVLLAVGGALAVTRVVGERDRADAAAQRARAEEQKAVDRADQLTLTQARIEAEVNPTRALAMVKPLAAKHWREVRSIGAAAQANGVAYGMPASKLTTSIELSRDGTRALTAGDDGVVRIYDLAGRTATPIRADLGGPGPAHARWADEERRVVAWRDRRLTVVDATTLAARDLTAPTNVIDLEVVGITAYWVDDAQALWQLDLAGTTPIQIPLPEPVTQLSPSPDGRYIALFGRDHLLFLDRTAPAEPPHEVALGATRDFDWSIDGKYFGALADHNAFLGTTDPHPHYMHRLHVGDRSHVAYGNDRLYTIGPTGVGMVSREQSGPRKPLSGTAIGLAEARGGTIVAASRGGLIVLSDFGDRALAAPTGKLHSLRAHARSPYVVATTEHQLLVWNLDELEPRRISDRMPGQVQLVGGDAALVTLADSGTHWIDLPSGTATPLGTWPLHSATGAPSGKLACAIDLAHQARLVAPGAPGAPAPEPRLIPGEFDVAGFVTEDKLVLGNGAAGTLYLYDARSGVLSPLFAAKGKLLDLAWSRAAPWVAAVFEDRTLWRRHLATGEVATTAAPVRPTIALQVADDGAVLLAEARTVHAWRAGGAIAPHVELPRAIKEIGLAGPGRLLALLDDRSAHLIELSRPNTRSETETIADGQEAITISMAPDSGAMVVVNRGGIELIDPVARHRWTLAVQPSPTNIHDPNTATRYADPRISGDGTRVLARLSASLVAWSLAVPANPADTARWIEARTNAAIEGTGKLVWR